jgi:hypothetical protein
MVAHNAERKTIDARDLEIVKDRTQDMRVLCARLLDAWGYDLEKRKPGVAWVDPDGIPVTDLDLAAFLTPLVENRVVVNLPKYTSRRAATQREGEWVTSKDNRHGRLTGLVSNKEAFSFGIRIEDMNVIQAKEKDDGQMDADIGAFRALLIQDVTGKWYEGWETIDIMPTGLSKEVFQKLSGAANTLKFQYLVHPMRWPSMYGVYYIVAKAAILRIEDQTRHLRSEVKRLREELGVEPPKWPRSEKVGEDEPIKVWAFEATLDGVDFTGEYEKYASTQEDLNAAIALEKRLRGFVEQLRFLTRCTEYSFWTHAVQKNIPADQCLYWLKGETGPMSPTLPTWIKKAGKQWVIGWKESEKKKICWARMEMIEGYHLRWRVWQKTERVAKRD